MVAMANMSRTNFYNRLNDLTGLSPEQFLNDFRLKKAIALLDQSNYSLIEIAQMTGFGDALNITRVFQQRMGMTPNHYREVHSNATINKQSNNTSNQHSTSQDNLGDIEFNEHKMAMGASDITDDYEIIED